MITFLSQKITSLNLKRALYDVIYNIVLTLADSVGKQLEWHNMAQCLYMHIYTNIHINIWIFIYYSPLAPVGSLYFSSSGPLAEAWELECCSALFYTPISDVVTGNCWSHLPSLSPCTECSGNHWDHGNFHDPHCLKFFSGRCGVPFW